MTESLSLVLLAAGHGRRFGGDKQLKGFGPGGELLLEYDLYDARRAGFDRAVIVVRPEMEARFRERLDDGAARAMAIEYAHQVGPGGTGHALLMARHLVSGAFAVANADDIYGPAAFAVLADVLAAPGDDWAMVGFELARTLSPSGPVSRALCLTDENGRLTGLAEMPQVTVGATPIEKDLCFLVWSTDNTATVVPGCDPGSGPKSCAIRFSYSASPGMVVDSF
ncbi:MAG: NTP transferase domain-containing protein, partial [Planctomycetota bacterium]